MNVKINNNALNKITNQQVGPIVGKKIEKSLIQNVQKAQREMIQELESHPVTKEIESGPNGTNQSGTLGGYGNLFSFIGFERGMSPINPIRKIIKKTLAIRSVPASQKSLTLKFEVEVPDKEELFQNSPMPWQEGRSWAEGIERGISGLGNYINKSSSSSRSSQGVQVKNRIRSGQFRNTKYLSSIINNFKKNVLNFIK